MEVATRQDEFERLAMPHTRSLLRVARRLTSDRHRNLDVAEDLVQETMLLAWRGFRQFRAGTNERAWLFRILINAVYARGRKLRVTPDTVPIAERDLSQVADASREASPIEALEIAQALDTLPVDQREVLLLAVVEGFTCQETADILAIPIGTVMSRLSRARQALRDLLAPKCETFGIRSMGKEA
jgi:RNA polymerase sigma-70 factor (ECF subfamily)